MKDMRLLKGISSSGKESFLLAELLPRGVKILVERNFKVAQEAASVAKVFLAAETIRLLESEKIHNQQIKIKKSSVEFRGTDVLADMVGKGNTVSLDILTLIGLMVKYSCNSSALVLSKEMLPNRKFLDRVAKNVWRLKDSKLATKDGKRLNRFSLRDLLLIFSVIYSKRGNFWEFLREKLKTSRNIYYLFDQQELDILGSKSGTKKVGSTYFINDCGVFRYNNTIYFMGAMVSNKSISRAVLRIREIGKELVSKLKSRDWR